MAVQFLASGDTGLTVQFGFDVDRGLSAQIMALRSAVDDASLVGVVETVPTYRSLLVHYDPMLTSQSKLIAALKPMIAQLDGGRNDKARLFTLPLCWEGDLAPDLAHVADFAKMSPEEVISVLTETEHFIYMLGFAPGMPYMGDLPQALNIPRKTVPVKRVEKGSVMVATGLTVIYPAANPTGWHVVGRCPVPIFDLGRADPVFLSPGDRVRFRVVDTADFARIESLVAEGHFDLEELAG
nr:allophanate hydrolase subunit 1 [uncultured Cohaesibacter sp.]